MAGHARDPETVVIGKKKKDDTTTTSTPTAPRTNAPSRPSRKPRDTARGEEKYFIRVDICRPDTREAIIEDVDIKAIRRYSDTAKPHLPIENTTTVKNPENIKYFMQPVGYRQPSDKAVRNLVIHHFNAHKHDERPPTMGKSYFLYFYAFFWIPRPASIPKTQGDAILLDSPLV
jgi:hypothetical protein